MNNDFIDGHPRSEASQQLVSVFTALVTTKCNTSPHRKHNGPSLLRTQTVLYNNRSIHCPYFINIALLIDSGPNPYPFILIGRVSIKLNCFLSIE
jgi:hypothetical protein